MHVHKTMSQLVLFCLLAAIIASSFAQQTNFINRTAKVRNYAESGWFLSQIPFIDIPDSEIEEIYYYRWSSHKRHLRYTLPGGGYSVTEFIHKVFYAGKYDTIVAAAGHHIFESRWLRDRRFNQDYINFWTRDDALTHAYSEWIAAAAYENYLVDRDEEFFKSQQAGLARNLRKWESNFNANVGMYFLSSHDDAMEQSCSSIPSEDPYRGGVGYRPSFNSELYANFLALAQGALLNGDVNAAENYRNQAAALRRNILTHLWDPERKFFYHMMRDNNPNMTLIASREEIGFFPWRWGVPDNTTDHAAAWEQLYDPMGFNTAYGPTTCEVRSQYYDGDQESGTCCWWNGNSWPYSTGFTLNSLAALIREYGVSFATAQDYINLLRKYAATQYKNDKPYVAECHSPGRDLWVGDSFNHSEHYAHSTYTDNVLSELIGLLPQPDDTLKVYPLVPNNWRYFAVENVLYHGHEVSVIYDADGSHYETGNSGLQVYVNGQLVGSRPTIGPLTVQVPPPIIGTPAGRNKVENIAANAESVGYPRPTVSYNGPSSSPWQAIDGRIFYDFLPSNRWSNFGSGRDSDWIAVDFGPGRNRNFSSVKVYIYSDVVTGEGRVDCPTSMRVQYLASNGAWTDVQNPRSDPQRCSPNDVNTITFDPVVAQEVRLIFERDLVNDYYVGITEVEIWTPWPQNSDTDTYEAEDALVLAAEIQQSAQASSGAFVGQIASTDSSVAFSGVWADSAGDYSLRIYYANGENTAATHNILVNNDYSVIASYQPTGAWGTFGSFVTVPVTLQRGNNVLIFTQGNNVAELDRIQIF